MSTVIQQDNLVSILKSNARVSSKIEELKSVDINNIPMQDLEQIFYNTDDTLIQRELVSVIGRARDVRYQDFLLSLLMASDPKIVMQAIRGLLCFKNESINAKIQNLMNHQNEMVKDYVRQVFYSNKNEKSNASINKNSDKTKDVVVLGDTLDIMKAVPSESLHLTFTSPPYYNARDYSIYQSYNEYLEFLSAVFKQVHRITQEGRFLVVNTSPIIIPRAGRQFSSKRYPIPFDIHRYIMDAGFEFIDDIIWVKPEASVKDRNGGFKQHRKPLAYKPNTVTEYVMVYRKKTDKLIDWNIKQYDDSVVESSKIKNEYETTNLWKIDPRSDRVHSAIFPDELCKRIISFYSYIGDTVFDPFAGSGTLGKVALENNRNCFLTEINPEYFERIKQKLGGLFTNNVKYTTYQDFISFINEDSR